MKAAYELDDVLTRNDVAVVVVDPTEGPSEELVRGLAEWARRLDLVVVCDLGSDASARYPRDLVTGLREALPQRGVVAVLAADETGGRHELLAVANLVEEGSIAVVVSLAGDPAPVAQRLGRHLKTDAVLTVGPAGPVGPTPD